MVCFKEVPFLGGPKNSMKFLGRFCWDFAQVRAMRLNSTGQLLATASARGTVVRLWVPWVGVAWCSRGGLV